MHLNNFQFLRYLIYHELQLDRFEAQRLLACRVEIINENNKDKQKVVQITNNSIFVQNPTSLLNTIFRLSYKGIVERIVDLQHLNASAVALLDSCREYVLADYPDRTSNKRTVLMDFEKYTLASVLVHEIIEPLVGKVIIPKVMFAKSPFIDACLLVESSEQLFALGYSSDVFEKSDFPLLIINSSIHNRAAHLSDVIFKVLVLSIGEFHAYNLIEHILLNDKTSLLEHIVSIIKTLDGNPVVVFDFLKFLKSNVMLSQKDEEKARKNVCSALSSKNFLKISNTGRGGWHQWSMIVGLIEKQLGPTRGSSWPTSKNLGPLEQEFQKSIMNRAQKKGKNQLNFEELLEVAREHHSTYSSSAGQLYEDLLKNNRVWKI